MNALADFLYRGHLHRPAFEVRCKTGLATPRGGFVHHVERMAAVRDGRRLQFAARWLCGGASHDVVIVTSAEACGGVACHKCAEIALGPVVYRCLGADGELLYVGSTGSGSSSRLQAHAKNASWWPEVADVRIEHFPSLLAARGAELTAIRTEHPVHNRAGRDRRLAAVAAVAS